MSSVPLLFLLFILTIYRHQLPLLPDYLHTTVFCIERLSHLKTKPCCSRTSTIYNSGKTSGSWLAFNPDKCEVLRVTNKRSPLTRGYSIHGQVLNITDSAKYLGLNIHKSLTWVDHVDKMTKKANSTLAFLSRKYQPPAPPTLRHSVIHVPPLYDQLLNMRRACGTLPRKTPSTIRGSAAKSG